jgi:hypothetical protein
VCVGKQNFSQEKGWFRERKTYATTRLAEMKSCPRRVFLLESDDVFLEMLEPIEERHGGSGH